MHEKMQERDRLEGELRGREDALRRMMAAMDPRDPPPRSAKRKARVGGAGGHRRGAKKLPSAAEKSELFKSSSGGEPLMKDLLDFEI